MFTVEFAHDRSTAVSCTLYITVVIGMWSVQGSPSSRCQEVWGTRVMSGEMVFLY